MPTISVIIPTYNRAAVVTEAIDSVLAQTFRDFEVLVIDDGSTDDTRARLVAYGERIRLICQENHGVSHARNVGIRAARGQYIALLDSDDLWLPKKLDMQIAVMEAQPDIPLCHTEEIWIRRGVRVNQMKKHQKHGGYIFPNCLPFCVISPSSVLIRRALFDSVGLFDEALPACEDYDLWLRVAKTYPVHFIETPLIMKRGGHDDQLSRIQWGLDRFRIQALDKLLQVGGLTDEQFEQTRQEFERKCEIFAQGCAKRGKTDEAQQYRELARKYC